jgi:hypothetical protein
MQRLVTFENAEARPTPLVLLGELRRIDETVELVYPGDGRWWLGAVRLTDSRVKRGENILAFEATRDHPNRRNIFLGKLAIQGFALIATYHGADPAGVVTVDPGDKYEYQTTILEDFRERDAAWRRDGGERAFDAKLQRTLGTARTAEREAEMQAYTASDGRDHYRREVRNRVTFGPGGMTGGPGRILIHGAT